MLVCRMKGQPCRGRNGYWISFRYCAGIAIR